MGASLKELFLGSIIEQKVVSLQIETSSESGMKNDKVTKRSEII